jgi:hypothetical protein
VPGKTVPSRCPTDAQRARILFILLTGLILLPLGMSACVTTLGSSEVPAPFVAAERTDAERWKMPLLDQGGNPDLVHCRPNQVWDPELKGAARELAQETLAAMTASGMMATGLEAKELFARVEGMAMWALVRRLLLGGKHHNFGGFALQGVETAHGSPVIVYRTGITANPNEPGSCVHSLLRYGQVRHVVNLYAGPMPTTDLEVAERQATQDVRGTYFLARKSRPEVAEWREHLREHGKEAHGKVSKTVARLINEEVLHPNEAPPKGNVHLHCGGGMHRTGMIMAILDRCINGTEHALIESDFRRHVAWRSEEFPGGFEQANLDFVYAFDCGLLDAQTISVAPAGPTTEE